MPYGLVTLLFKRRTAVMAIFLTIALGGIAYVLVTVPKYESDAQLVVRFGDRSIPDVTRSQVTELTPADRREIVLSHAAILGSHDLAQATINSFGVDKIYPDIVANPPTRWSTMDEAVRVFTENLSVDVGAQDNIISVSMLHPDKVLVPQIVKRLIDLYVQHESAVYQNPELKFLAGEVKQAGSRLSDAQDALVKFTGEYHITDYDQEVQALLKQRGDVDINLRTAQASLALARNRQRDMQRIMQGIPAQQTEAVNGERYRALDDAKTRLGDLKLKQSQMLATYAPNSPFLTTLNAGIASAEAEVRARQQELEARASPTPNTVFQTLQTDYLRARADAQSDSGPVGVLSTQLSSIDTRLQTLQQERGTFDDLTRKRQIAEDTFKSLSAQYEDARVKDNLNQQRISPATVLSAPTIPYRTARPRTLIVLLASFFGGAILAIGGALLLEAMDDRFATAEQVAVFLEIPVLASFERGRRHVSRALITSESSP